jgi:type II secretory pathway pseudopilin PulG
MTTSESDATDQQESDDKASHDVLEVIATVVLGIAITLIAWNALQSSLWSGEQAKATTDAVLTSNASNDSYQLADGIKTLDQLLFVEIFTSGVCDDGENADDVACDQIVNNMSLPGQEALIAWFDNDELLPFDSEAYGVELYSEAEALDVESNDFVVAADQANTNADRYDTASTTLATVLFFAGISLVIAWRRLRIVLLGIASVILIGSAVYVATLPIV